MKWLTVASLLWASVVMAGFIPADDPNFQYTGRIDFSNKKAPEFSWAGTSVRTKFTGTSLKVKLNEKGGGMYYAFVDGNYDSGHVITCDQGEKTYDVATGLESKTHDLLIYKRTDGGKATTAFLGLELGDGATLKAPGPRPKLRMEVYGDSISTGLGCDRKRGKEHSREATDNFFSYGSITARNIGAELRCISKSGIGLIKSWWPTIMPQYYDRACATSLEGAGKQWDFSKWQPHIVVINIFQNDSWTRKNTTSEEGVSAYVDFVKKLRGHYPNARIVCVLGSMDASKGKFAGFVKDAVKQLNDAGDTKVYSYMFKVQTGHTHPNSKVHAKMAQELTQFLTTLDMDITLTTPLPVEAKEVTSNFTPDPSKTYTIDCPSMGLRLAGGGAQVSEYGYTVTTPRGVGESETGAHVEWKFVAVGDKWHIQLAAGGEDSRLWAVKLPKARGIALTSDAKSGGWAQFKISGVSNGKCFVTAPDGPNPSHRLQILPGGKVAMSSANNTDSSAQLDIREAGAAEAEATQADTGYQQAYEAAVEKAKGKDYHASLRLHAAALREYGAEAAPSRLKIAELKKDPLAAKAVEMREFMIKAQGNYRRGALTKAQLKAGLGKIAAAVPGTRTATLAQEAAGKL
jgi:hypothetical protein